MASTPTDIEHAKQAVRGAAALVNTLVDVADQIELLNEFKRILHAVSPLRDEPVDCVIWELAENVTANDYNPNAVAPPEMELLRVSIEHDGFTQPIVSFPDGDTITVVDGFHRSRVAKECEDIRERVHGYAPIVTIRPSQDDRGDRIASTIRHNRARGKHRVDAMADIVLELKRRNWSDAKIGKELGMDPDEVLRLAQVQGLAVAFADRDFSEAWEAIINPSDDLGDETGDNNE
jgi:ParB-like chromosome segregation protein Spo0J